ncbi:hypothetical protein EXIGLDRAFT_695100 [Exidia glandulosa HHB12029]|uniref:Uncharacterized protein n=1 Tax=Exidia glandulosa HHB12029 TaxID=1314781 RepID=A0A165G4K1_EXIGL|nr:hypothetical protein EXIGLDRAFT_695100 [Exidia glandulosa HHB12029]
MASRPDHWQFTVSTDSGPPTLGNTWSIAPSCGVTYSKSSLALAAHTIKVNNKPNGGTRSFLELLSIIQPQSSSETPDKSESTSSSAAASSLSRRALIAIIAVLAALLGAATTGFIGYLTWSCHRRRLRAEHVHPFHVDGGALPPPSPYVHEERQPRAATAKYHGTLLTTGGTNALSRPLSREDIERIAVRVQDVLSSSTLCNGKEGY